MTSSAAELPRFRRIGRARVHHRRRNSPLEVELYLTGLARPLRAAERERIEGLFRAAVYASERLGEHGARWEFTRRRARCVGVAPSLALGLATRLNAVVDGRV